MLTSSFVKGWYELAKQVSTDVASLWRRKRSPIETEVCELHAALSDIHAHYVELFAGIENKLIGNPSPHELDELRSSFFELRSQKYTGRAMSREKIASLVKLDEANEFEDFLNAAHDFLIHGPAPNADDKIGGGKFEPNGTNLNFHRDRTHKSSSYRYWKKMLNSNDPEELAQIARSELRRLTDLYSTAKKAFLQHGLGDINSG